jgi:hypothetical protein
MLHQCWKKCWQAEPALMVKVATLPPNHQSLPSNQSLALLAAFKVSYKHEGTEKHEDDATMNGENKCKKKNMLKFASLNVQSMP